MSSRRRGCVPSYRLHKQSGQAVVTLTDAVTKRRRDVLLGPYGTPGSRAEYARVIAEWLAAGRGLPRRAAADAGRHADLTVNELILAYWERHVRGYSVKDGRPTSQQDRIRYALPPVRELYGHTPAGQFGPLALKAVRQVYVERHGYVRRYANQLVGCVK